MRPYILLTVDSLRADCTTPDLLGDSLRILEKDFVTFSNAISYGVATPFSFPGIISGTHPTGDGMISDGATTIAEGTPGRSVAYSNNGHLNRHRGYARGFDKFVEDTSLEEGTNLADRLISRLRQIEAVQNSELAQKIYQEAFREPLPLPYSPAEEMSELVQEELSKSSEGLLWAHWMDPHTPYHPRTSIDPPSDVPSLEELEDINDRLVQGSGDDISDAEADLLHNLYKSNIRYYDHHFSRLLEWIQDQSWYDDAFIVIVSDHGEYFGEHDLFFHPWDTDPYDEAIRTPLWVKYPNQVEGGEKYDHLVGHGDILATIGTEFDEVEVQVPEHTAPLRDTSGRHIVSVSNTVKRLTETDGAYFERRDGTSEEHGEISLEGQKFLQHLDFPECSNLEGGAIGVEEAERQKRLTELGYR